MKVFILITALLSPMLTLGSQNKSHTPSSTYPLECVKSLKRKDRYKVQACKNIKNKHALTCVKSFSKKEISSVMINACVNVNNKFAADCVQAFNINFSSTINACAKIHDNFGFQCVNAFSRLYDYEIEECATIHSDGDTIINDETQFYTVKAGDTLFSIALDFGLSFEEIIMLNVDSVVNIDNIQVGIQLRVK